ARPDPCGWVTPEIGEPGRSDRPFLSMRWTLPRIPATSAADSSSALLPTSAMVPTGFHQRARRRDPFRVARPARGLTDGDGEKGGAVRGDTEGYGGPWPFPGWRRSSARPAATPRRSTPSFTGLAPGGRIVLGAEQYPACVNPVVDSC